MSIERIPKEEINFPGKLFYWAGWLVYDAKICQFELDQWFFALDKAKDDVNCIYHQIAAVERTISLISRWQRF